MAGKSSTVTVQILADNSQFKREMSETEKTTGKTTKKVESFSDKASKKMDDFSKVAVAAIAVKALGAVKQFVGDSLTAYSDLNESLNALEVQYGEHADGIKKLGEEAAQNLGLSNAEFNSFAVSLSAFAKQIAGDSGDVVGTVDTLTTRVSDFASVMNLDVGEAAEKFRSGLAGESEPLRQFGIDVSDAKVKAQALAEGIWDGTGAMTESQKVQARFSTIMAQTSAVQGDFANTADDAANKQRILDAELENTKALLGQSILPLQQAWQEVQAKAIPIVAQLAIELGRFTGALSDAEAALLKFKTEEGKAVETADELLTAISSLGSGSPLADWVGGLFDMTAKTDDWVEAMKEGIQTADLSEEEYRSLTVQLNTLREAGDLTNEQQKDLNETIENNQAAKARDDYRNLMTQLTGTSGAFEYMAGKVGQLEDAQEDLNVDVRTGIELAREAYDVNRANTDALFGVKEATRKQAEAQTAVNEALKEFEAGSPEHIQALENLAGANGDVESAQIKLVEQGGLTREEFVNQQISLGLLREDAELLADEYNELFTPREVTHTITVNNVSKGNPGRVPGRQHGGPVRKDQPVLVAEDGKPELFVPESNGTIIPNGKLRGNGGTPLAGGMAAYITINAGLGTDPRALERAVVEALQSWQRSNGAIPITTRSA